MADSQTLGATFGGPPELAATFGPGPLGATFGGEPTTPTPLADPLPATHGPGALGATFGGTQASGVTGALYSNEQTPGQLLAGVDGWGLVVEPVPEPGHTDTRLLFTPTGSERAADGALLSIQSTIEALAVDSLQVEFAAEPRLFRFAHGRFAFGFDGERLLSGRFEAPDADSGSQQATITGFGALDQLRSGGVDVSYAGMPAWQALRQFYDEEVIPRTDGQIRGVVVPPNPVEGQREAMIPPDDPLELSGAPMEALAELHGFGGYVWSVDYDDRGYGCEVESFLPGTQLRDALWTVEQGGHAPTLDIGDYHADVIVHGAAKPGVGEANTQDADRYRGEASVSEMEAQTITGGDRLIFETTKDGLESDAACRTWARSKLDELRGSYGISGDLDVVWGVAGDLTPGHTYRVPEFDSVAPPALSPAVLPLRSIEYSYAAGEADVSLSFGPIDDGLIGTLLGRDDPPLALRGINRLGGADFDSAARLRNPYAAGYPHAYADVDDSASTNP